MCVEVALTGCTRRTGGSGYFCRLTHLTPHRFTPGPLSLGQLLLFNIALTRCLLSQRHVQGLACVKMKTAEDAERIIEVRLRSTTRHVTERQTWLSGLLQTDL